MYLEISARQTGKTTRLVDHIIVLLMSHKVVALQSCNYNHTLDIVKEVKRRGAMNMNNLITFTSIDRLESKLHGSGKSIHDLYYCYDEFDFISKKDIYFSQRGYYCTTSKFTRSAEYILNWKERGCNAVEDPLLKLLTMNRGMSVNVSAFPRLFENDNIDDMYQRLDPKQLDTEFNNNFIDISKRYEDDTIELMKRVPLNPNLIFKNGLSDFNIQKIQYLHVKKDRLFKEVEKFNPQWSKFHDRLQHAADRLEKIEFEMQKHWGFDIDRTYHTHWMDMPYCICPKKANKLLMGYDQKIINELCPVHGKGKNDE